MSYRPFIVSVLIVLCLFGLSLSFACRGKSPDVAGTAWLDDLYGQGKDTFYKTVRSEITAHPKRASLTEAELQKIQESEARYPRLYGIMVNVYYQKDEPTFTSLLDKGDKKSRQRFSSMYLDLARFAGHMFVESFFATDMSTDLIRKVNPNFKGLDAVDLVVRSVGYGAKLDAPPPREFFSNPVSPEFELQGALDGARFRQAHAITRGKGAKIAILDSGIDESHSIFKTTKWGKNFSLVGRDGRPWSDDASLVDWGWHGTLITSVAACYAPGGAADGL